MPAGTVKWFNPQKGYGFIRPDVGGPDVFVHITVLQRVGLTSLAEGQTVDYEIALLRGKSCATDLVAGPTSTGSSRRVNGSARERPSVGRRTGVVKWFELIKGYGFIVPDDGGPDVFVNIKQVERSGFANGIEEGDRLSFDTVPDGRSGKVKAENLEHE